MALCPSLVLDVLELSVYGFTLRVMVVTDGMDEIVAEMERSALAGAESMLRTHGVCARPSVFMFVSSPTLGAVFMGSVTARRYARGQDAADAVRGLGLLPSVLAGPRLLVAWENAELCMAFGEPGEEFPAGLVMVDATLDDHIVRWHPFTPRYGAKSETMYASVIVEWRAPSEQRGAALPGPVAELLGLWREQRGGNLDVTRAALQRSGFGVSWLADMATEPGP
ncbi:hypothetical protein [Pseudonocardia nigra]|uniref:hypothetical protein n=1 Tax=Pseudonocardia nigra TaxID=1921578 RepID=UPI001C5FF72B|nr:hypothetical protein [Pseudonocardia nigra]